MTHTVLFCTKIRHLSTNKYLKIDARCTSDKMFGDHDADQFIRNPFSWQTEFNRSTSREAY